MTTSTIDVRPLTGYTGAEIFGVDLSRPLHPEEVAEVRQALLQWKAVFFRDQDITPDQQLAFAQRFGDVTPAHPTIPGLADHPEILVVSDRKRQRAADGAGPAVPEYHQNGWHSDVTFVHNPPFASVLYGLVTPPYGGDTSFSNLVVAYEALSAPIRELVDGLQAVHANILPTNSGGADRDSVKKRFESITYRTVHPVVRVHPETGERALYVNENFTQSIVGLSTRESRALLDLLFDHIANPSFTARFRWADRSVAFWDNRAVAHLAPGDLGHLDFDRVMHRVTLEGDVPVGPDGFVSEALDGADFVEAAAA